MRRAEREYAARLRELDGGFEVGPVTEMRSGGADTLLMLDQNIGSSFAVLESKITGVGRTAIRIGEQLEALHISRSTAQSTSILLSYYLSLASPVAAAATPAKTASGADGEAAPAPPQTPLETLFASRTTREGRVHLAVILRRLAGLARDIREIAHAAVESHRERQRVEHDQDRAGHEGARLQSDLEKAERILDEVDKYGERFEKECLRLFDRSYRKGDVRMMAVRGGRVERAAHTAHTSRICPRTALRQDPARLQRGPFVRSDVRQPA